MAGFHSGTCQKKPLSMVFLTECIWNTAIGIFKEGCCILRLSRLQNRALKMISGIQIPQFLLDADVISDQLQHRVGAGDTGEHALRINIGEGTQRQIG